MVRAIRIPATAVRVSQRIFDAEVEADAILKSAKDLKNKMLHEGMKQGQTQGLARATEEMAAALADATRIRQQASNRLIELATRMAEKIVGKAIEIKPEIVVSVARKALLQVSWCRSFVVKVNPEDLEEISRHRQDLVAAVDAVDALHLEADAEISRGGCIVECEAGQVDATLESQLAALEHALLSKNPGENDP